jgi:hypothetical protein
MANVGSMVLIFSNLKLEEYFFESDDRVAA